MHAVILNGGAARRLGGRDKARLSADANTLLGSVISRLQGQCSVLAINAPRGRRYPEWPGLEIFEDRAPGYRGPMAGIMTALRRWPEQSVLTVAVDLPLLPRSLSAPLAVALQNAPEAVCSYAATLHAGDRRHALAVLWRAGCARRVAQAYGQHGPRLGLLLAVLGVAVVFPACGDEDLDVNVNTDEDWQRAAACLGPRLRAP